jgi:hypothetical protein
MSKPSNVVMILYYLPNQSNLTGILAKQKKGGLANFHNECVTNSTNFFLRSRERGHIVLLPYL